MINNPIQLTELCELAVNFPQKHIFKVALSKSMKKRLGQLQLKDTYPRLLAWNQGRVTYLAKVK